MSEDKLLSALKASESLKESEKNFDDTKPKINFSTSKIKKIEKNLFKPKKYYHYDDIEYKGIKSVKNLFDLSINEDYYKPITTNGAFNNNYIQYESKGNKDKILTLNEYLDIIRPYLSDIINDKTQGEWRIHSGNTIIKHKTQSEWKIQLTMAINFISSKDYDDICTMHAKSNNVEIMMGSETNEIIEELFKSFFCKDIKKG